MTIEETYEESVDVFDADRTPFTRRMADGHAIRCGHALTGYYVPTDTAGIVQLVRTCCEGGGAA